MKTAYLSLGSNLGDRAQNLEKALDHLELGGVHVARRSSLYETEPQELRDQPWFLNMVVEVETRLFPLQLLTRVLRIERDMGRERLVPKGPRIVDIDILLYGPHVVNVPQLQIPHPGLTARRFVLEPLVELAPHLRHPVLRKSMRELLASVSGQIVKLRNR